MALKDIFTMVKADRYTQDGREEINKAHETETEDTRRTYQIGEISETTGMQKTANGWRPPKETKFGKVQQNKEGQWGVQTKQGKGSDFLKHKSEKEASRALANYTAGYNTTERSKQDPHSDEARQVKQWRKEDERAAKARRAEGRTKHAAQFLGLEAGPDTGAKLSHKDHIDLANEVKANGDNWTAEEIAKEWNLTKGDAEAVKKEIDNASKPAAESKPAEGRNFREAMEREPKSSYDFAKTVEHSIPMSSGDKEVLGRVKDFMEEEGTDYKDALKSVAAGLVNGNKLHGDWYPEKEQSLLKIAKAVGMDNEVKSYVKTMAKGYDFGYSEDSAPRVLTGDTKIHVRKA